MSRVEVVDVNGVVKRFDVVGNASDYPTEDLVHLLKVGARRVEFSYGLITREPTRQIQFNRYSGEKNILLRNQRLTGHGGAHFALRLRKPVDGLSEVEYLAAIGRVPREEQAEVEAIMPASFVSSLGQALVSLLCLTSYRPSEGGLPAVGRAVSKLRLRVVKKRGQIDEVQKHRAESTKLVQATSWDLSKLGADLNDFVESKSRRLQYAQRRAKSLGEDALEKELVRAQRQLEALLVARDPLNELSTSITTAAAAINARFNPEEKS